MLQGNSITGLEELNLFGCFRLAARIYDLRENIEIESRTIRVNDADVKEYWIPRTEAIRILTLAENK